MKNLEYKVNIVIFIFLLALAFHLLPRSKFYEYAILDYFDKRPEVDVLFVGNSRTFYNDMPIMVHSIADSANSKNKYHITMYATAGPKLENHLKDEKVSELLKNKWNYVVLQGASSENLDDTKDASFINNGTQLTELVKESGAVPVLFVAWCYGADHEVYKQMNSTAQQLYWRIQNSYNQLAQTTGASLVNVGKVSCIGYH